MENTKEEGMDGSSIVGGTPPSQRRMLTMSCRNLCPTFARGSRTCSASTRLQHRPQQRHDNALRPGPTDWLFRRIAGGQTGASRWTYPGST
jgi:hypothetical protein